MILTDVTAQTVAKTVNQQVNTTDQPTLVIDTLTRALMDEVPKMERNVEAMTYIGHTFLNVYEESGNRRDAVIALNALKNANYSIKDIMKIKLKSVK